MCKVSSLHTLLHPSFDYPIHKLTKGLSCALLENDSSCLKVTPEEPAVAKTRTSHFAALTACG